MRPAPDERGDATAELAILAPLLLVVIASILLLGQLGLARTRVADAAGAAAEAAAIAAGPSTAEAAAEQAATSALANAGVTCAPSSLQLDLADFVPGGRVRASVSCTVAIAREAVPGMPGHLTLQASALAPVDPYRNSP
jgi:Flp pilus assembly protein TadG